ncbi:MAG: hypothetical protein ACYC61_03520 [Isosphaeraceae bacterium]
MDEAENSAGRPASPVRWAIHGQRILAAARLAFDVRKLAIAAAGLLVLQLGWAFLDGAFAASAEVTPEVFESTAAAAGPSERFSWSWETVQRLSHRLFEPSRTLLAPLGTFLDPHAPGLSKFHGLLAVVWLILVWGPAGGAIARMAVVQAARSRCVGMGEAVRFGRSSAGALVLSPLFPLIGLAFCSLTGLVFGLIYRLPGGPAAAGVLLFIPMSVAVVMTLFVAALVAGWPMFHAAVASGAEDALDAMVRTYSYLTQRLALFGIGVAVAWATGLAGLALAELLVETVIRLAEWSVALTGPGPAIASLFDGSGPRPAGPAPAAHRFWLGVARLTGQAWVYSFFWTAASLIYLGLRHEVDGTPASVVDPIEPPR